MQDQFLHRGRIVDEQVHAQYGEPHAAQDGKQPVRGNLCKGLGEVVILLELILLRVRGLRGHAAHNALLEHALAERAPRVGVETHALGEDVVRAEKRFLGAADQPRGVDEVGGVHLRRGQRLMLQPDIVRQRLQALVARDARLGPPLPPERQIEVFQLGLVENTLDAVAQFGSELLQFGDVLEHGVAPVGEGGEIVVALLNPLQLLLIEIAGVVLAIVRGEGHRGALVE